MASSMKFAGLPMMDEHTQSHRASPTRRSIKEVMRILSLQRQRAPATLSAHRAIDEEEDVIAWQCHHAPNILPHPPGAPHTAGMVELPHHDQIPHQMRTSNMRVHMLPRHSATTHGHKWDFLPISRCMCAVLAAAYFGLAVFFWLVTPVRLDDAELALIRLLVTLEKPQQSFLPQPLMQQSWPQPTPPPTHPLALSLPRERRPALHNPLLNTLYVPAASPRDAAAESRPKVLLAPTPSSEITALPAVTTSDELTGEPDDQANLAASWYQEWHAHWSPDLARQSIFPQKPALITRVAQQEAHQRISSPSLSYPKPPSPHPRHPRPPPHPSPLPMPPLSPLPPPLPPPPPPPPPLNNMGHEQCTKLLRDRGSQLHKLWSAEGWRKREASRGDPACWPGDGQRFFDDAWWGKSCGRNWYMGNKGRLGDTAGGPDKNWVEHHFTAPAPALLGFDRNIDWHCHGNSKHHAESCIKQNLNILSLFGQQVPYNMCRNLEWQICAASGRLPGQGSNTIIFAVALKDLQAIARADPAPCTLRACLTESLC